MALADGQYQIRIIELNNNNLGSLIVEVDNNRSPLTKAIGTRYLLNNRLAIRPNVYDYYTRWDWFPDESGILYMNSIRDYYGVKAPVGLFKMTLYGDMIRLGRTEW